MQRVIFSTRWSGGYLKEDKRQGFFTVPNSKVGVVIEVPDEVADLAIADGAAKKTSKKVDAVASSEQDDPGDGPAPAAKGPEFSDKMERGGSGEGRRAK